MKGRFVDSQVRDKTLVAYFKVDGLSVLLVGRVKGVRGDLLLPDFSPYPLDIRSFARRTVEGFERTVVRISPLTGGLREIQCEFFAVETVETALNSWFEVMEFLDPVIARTLRDAEFDVPPPALLVAHLGLRKATGIETSKFYCGGLSVASDGSFRLYPRGQATAFAYHVRGLVREAERSVGPRRFELEAFSGSGNGENDRLPVRVSLSTSV